MYSKSNLWRGKQLKNARLYRGYSQSYLAKNIDGISQSNLSKFEKGINTISEQKQKQIMEFLNWPFEWLDRKPVDTHFFGL